MASIQKLQDEIAQLKQENAELRQALAEALGALTLHLITILKRRKQLYTARERP
jgi:hypothetical protein